MNPFSETVHCTLGEHNTRTRREGRSPVLGRLERHWRARGVVYTQWGSCPCRRKDMGEHNSLRPVPYRTRREGRSPVSRPFLDRRRGLLLPDRHWRAPRVCASRRGRCGARGRAVAQLQLRQMVEHHSQRGAVVLSVSVRRKDVFVHFSEIQGAGHWRTLAEGDPVELDVQQGPKGLQAVNVTLGGG